jgi:hypothetical protein
MDIEFPEGKALELWVRDIGLFDGIAVFLNGQRIKLIGDQSTHKFPIARPPSSSIITITFGGTDSGVTAIVDVTESDSQVALGRLTPTHGLTHEYRIKAV